MIAHLEIAQLTAARGPANAEIGAKRSKSEGCDGNALPPSNINTMQSDNLSDFPPGSHQILYPATTAAASGKQRSKRQDGLESVKKTHQVAGLGWAPSGSVIAGPDNAICRVRVNPNSAGDLPAAMNSDPTTSTQLLI
jgi:hypothetical protein